MIPIIVISPVETLKPANSMIASLGTGMHALSSVIRMNTPTTPTESMKSVAALTIGSEIEASGSARWRLSGPMRVGHVTHRPAQLHRKLARDAPPVRPCLPASGAGVRRRCAALRGRLCARLLPPLPRRRRPGPRSLRDDAGGIRCLRRPRQVADAGGPRSAPPVVALLPADRPVAAGPLAGCRERPARPRVRAGQAVPRQPPALRRDLRLHPVVRVLGRRAARAAVDR